ncbi:type II toxin-antitoxin system VapB family antitoxin [Desulfatitalea alkaliphila]|uniref:Type II toxin-antitoxin system VapB family antitoxin n=1 Tax=Desulfatitalea alkaliphila TaxID=2929485 RepID=A0AA41R6U6_9BACT|nr:type II toxin-antitoxin system VapB family antitoxin [Desulfatitalea alkaliphila]MCJ8502488.1 type II toxin-antitoxin system VapB family antitoxin [Desulfatitalea alkaliphila]
MPNQGSVFTNNRTQAVRLPADMRFPKGVKKVFVRSVGKERIISPVENLWDSFFISENRVTDDFLTERAEQTQSDREPF